jgi:hypothetical protein
MHRILGGSKGVLHTALAILSPQLKSLTAVGRAPSWPSATVVFPWIISNTSAALRRAVPRLISVNVLTCLSQ